MRCLRFAGAFASALLATVVAAGQEPAAEPTFAAVLFTAIGKYPHEVSAAYGDFTLAGPKVDTLKPLPQGIRHVAYDPAGKQLYGITNHMLCRLDPATREGTEIAYPADLPQLSWPNGIAFDTKRNRVVVAGGSGAGGQLYSFTPKTGKWAEISRGRDTITLAALTYDTKADRLYGLYQPHGEGKPKVAVFNAAGAVVGAIELSDPAISLKLDRGPIGRPVQLVVVGGELAVIAEDRIFALDLKTEKVRETWTRK
jgi:DNA-binding beta-propeller fold protein YncE